MPFPSIDDAKRMALEFCAPPKQPHMITINRAGVPRGRTLGVMLKPDFSIEVWGRRSNGRIKQVEHNPNISFIWDEGPATVQGQAPRVVFITGKGRLATFEEFAEWHERRLKERPNSPQISAEDAFKEQQVIKFTADEVRMEGFPAEGETLTFPEIASGLTFKP